MKNEEWLRIFYSSFFIKKHANIKQKKNNYYVWNCINFQHSGADS